MFIVWPSWNCSCLKLGRHFHLPDVMTTLWGIPSGREKLYELPIAPSQWRRNRIRGWPGWSLRTQERVYLARRTPIPQCQIDASGNKQDKKIPVSWWPPQHLHLKYMACTSTYMAWNHDYWFVWNYMLLHALYSYKPTIAIISTLGKDSYQSQQCLWYVLESAFVT